ncbi:MAG: biotin/lipoyl-binding protein [Streptosporangiales bacterium]|nr:biotin/lipoyl-binding protein [Streptosporangiales bacterium]
MADVEVLSEITGSVWKIEVQVGSEVTEEDPVAVLETMKMEIPVLAPQPGTVKELRVEHGQSVAEGDVLMVLAT